MEEKRVSVDAFGTDNLKKVVIFVVAIINTLYDVFSDGKFTGFADISKVLGLIPEVRGILKSVKEAYKEALDLSDAEAEALNRSVAIELDLTNENAKKIVKASFELILNVFDTISTFREVFKK